MEYTNIFAPLLCISLSILLGILIGVIFTIYTISRTNKELENELDRFRTLYLKEKERWENKYVDDDPSDIGV